MAQDLKKYLNHHNNQQIAKLENIEIKFASFGKGQFEGCWVIMSQWPRHADVEGEEQEQGEEEYWPNTPAAAAPDSYRAPGLLSTFVLRFLLSSSVMAVAWPE